MRLVNSPAPHRRRALEHHVLEHVGDAGGAVVLVHAADPVPDHLDGGRRAVVFLDDHAQAVGQRVFLGNGPLRLRHEPRKAADAAARQQ